MPDQASVQAQLDAAIRATSAGGDAAALAEVDTSLQGTVVDAQLPADNDSAPLPEVPAGVIVESTFGTELDGGAP